MFSVLGTFFGVLLVVMYAVGVSSGNALKGPDAFALRWTVISLAVAFSALMAWVRWLFLMRRARRLSAPACSVWGQGKATGPVTPAPSPVSGSGAPLAKVPEAILAAGRQAIVFRQHFPPPHDRSMLSFFGGAPIARPGFVWPRAAKAAVPHPLSFLMQIDCAKVPAPARLGLLPDDGVLYFFLDFRWGEDGGFRVLHEPGPTGGWIEVAVPDDLGTAFGNEAVYVWKWTQSLQDCPRLLPKWPFSPVVVEVPIQARDPDDDEDAPILWPGEKSMAEAMRRAQGEDVVSAYFSAKDFSGGGGTLIRPFENYPHDWKAIQICSGLIVKEAAGKRLLRQSWILKGVPEDQRVAAIATLRDEAEGWFDRATQMSHAQLPHAPVPQAERDAFWSWLAQREPLILLLLGDALTMSIEASLAGSHEASTLIPADAIRRVHSRHALAVRTDSGLFVNTPDRMLGPPVDVQGNQWERAQTHLLLLEISSNEGLGHHFGEGVYRFWIAPEDLKSRRFDKVELTTDAY